MTKRILLGKFPDGGAGLRISRPGKDVMANPPVQEDLQFNSDWFSALPIHQMGQVTVPNNATTTVVFPALAYPPMILAYVWDNDGLGPNTMLRMVNNDIPFYDDPGTGGTLVQKRFEIRSLVDRFTIYSGLSNPSRDMNYCVLRVPMR